MDDQFSLSDANQLKDFQCPICLKYFSRKFTLDMHLLIHEGVKPHPCPFCGKSFRQKGTLMRHKALHSANNLFHCSLCDRGFRQKNVFLYHLRHRHNVSTETLDRRKYPTQLKDYQSIMDTLPPFVLADSTAIASSEKHLDAMLFETLSNGICDSSISEGDMQNNCFVSQTTLPPEERQSVDDWDDTNICNLSNNQVNEGIGYKCDLCLTFFVDYTKYKQHVEVLHNNAEILLDSKPILRSSLSESYTLNSGDLPRNNVNLLVSTGNAIPHLSVTNNTLNAKANIISSSNDTNCIDKGKFCIPCQHSFANDEEFKCHLKTHVQSVLEESNASQDKSNAANSKQSNPSIKSKSDAPPLDDGSYFNFPTHNENNISFVVSTKRASSNTSDTTRRNITPILYSDSQVYSAESTSTNPGEKLQSKVQLLEDKVSNSAYNSKCHPSPGSSSCFPHSFYKCKLCNKLFRKRVTFEYHKQMHMDIRAFGCEYCRKKFGSKQLLLFHTRSKHMKTFNCDSCSRTFNYRSIFVFHKKNCSKNVNLEKGSKSCFSLPLVDVKELLSSDVTGIAGVIPICDKSNSKDSTFKYCIPIVSIEGMRNFSNFSFLNTLEINGSLK